MMEKLLNVHGKKNMKVCVVGMEEKFRDEKYFVGLKHNLPKRAFNYLLQTIIDCLEDDYLDSERLIFIINNAPLELEYKAEKIDDFEKKHFEENLEPKYEVIWR